MSKIDELEKRMIHGGLSDDLFEDYKKALKKVRGNFLKQQHCYSTAIQFPKHCSDKAIQLIEYGLENYPDSWFPTYTSYQYIGIMNEKAGKYPEAYHAYRSAYDSLPPDKKDYLNYISGKLMWMKLHVDGFQYSEEFEKLYNAFSETDDFSKGILDNEFILTVGRIVVSANNGDTDEARKAYDHAVKLCRPGMIGRLQQIFDGHRYHDKLHATREAKLYLKSVKLFCDY